MASHSAVWRRTSNRTLVADASQISHQGASLSVIVSHGETGYSQYPSSCIIAEWVLHGFTWTRWAYLGPVLSPLSASCERLNSPESAESHVSILLRALNANSPARRGGGCELESWQPHLTVFLKKRRKKSAAFSVRQKNFLLRVIVRNKKEGAKLVLSSSQVPSTISR